MSEESPPNVDRTEARIKELEELTRRLEITTANISGKTSNIWTAGTAVFSFLLLGTLAWLGVTSWIQIPALVEKSVLGTAAIAVADLKEQSDADRKTIDSMKTEAERVLDSLRAQTWASRVYDVGTLTEQHPRARYKIAPLDKLSFFELTVATGHESSGQGIRDTWYMHTFHQSKRWEKVEKLGIVTGKKKDADGTPVTVKENGTKEYVFEQTSAMFVRTEISPQSIDGKNWACLDVIAEVNPNKTYNADGTFLDQRVVVYVEGWMGGALPIELNEVK